MAQHQQYEPPNGGFQAWLAVLGSFLLQMSSFGYISACGIFQFYYAETLLPDKSASQLAWITTIQIFFFFVFGPPVGRLVDVFGARLAIAPFAALGIIAVGLLSLCKEYYQIMLCQGVLFGLACSGTTIPAVVNVSKWFSTRRGLAVGISSCGSSIGGVIYPIMVTRIMRDHGFPTAVKWSCLLVGITLSAGVLCCTDPPHVPDNDIGEKVNNESGRNDATPAEGSPEPIHSPKAKRSVLDGLRHNLFAFIAFITGGFFVMWAMFAPLNFLPEMAVASGMSISLAQYTVAITNAGSIFGRVIPGWLSDKYGQFNVMILVSVSSSILLLAFWLPLNYHPSNAGIIAFSAFYGFTSGGYISLQAPCLIALVDNRLEDLGVKFGLGCLTSGLGALVGLPILGAVRDASSGEQFSGLIGLSGGIMIIGTVCIMTCRIKKFGWKLDRKC
ncbi:MFS transporter [Xylogone sp. PMI_703]|nr:MFS transporter [Xylogone sp. PMI_703]